MARTKKCYNPRDPNLSPDPKDPHFSRVTPDKLYDSIVAAKPAGDNSTELWVARLLAAKARKAPKSSERRRSLLDGLENVLLGAKAKAVEKKPLGKKDSPMPRAREASPVTKGVCKQRSMQRCMP